MSLKPCTESLSDARAWCPVECKPVYLACHVWLCVLPVLELISLGNLSRRALCIADVIYETTWSEQ